MNKIIGVEKVRVASAVTYILKILFLFLLIIVISLGGIYWFDHLGLIDYKKVVGPLGKYLPVFLQRGEVTEDPLLLEKELLTKRLEALSQKEKELELNGKKLSEREQQVQQIEEKLKEESKSIENEKKLLSEKLHEYDNYKENVKKQAEYFTDMPPKAAVERLSQMNDLLVIDILRQIDKTAVEQGKSSVVPYYLSLMDPKKAASIQRKMTEVGEFKE